MPTPDLDGPEARSDHRGELRGFMRWWRGIGLGFVLLALYLFSRDQDTGGYVALAVGWAILIYAIVARSRRRRRRIRNGSGPN